MRFGVTSGVNVFFFGGEVVKSFLSGCLVFSLGCSVLFVCFVLQFCQKKAACCYS